MKNAPLLTPFHIRLSALEEGVNGALRLPPHIITTCEALARYNPSNGHAVLTCVPLDDGLRLGLPEDEERRLRTRLYEIAAARLGRRLRDFPLAEGEVPIVDLALPNLEKRMTANRAVHWRDANGSACDGGYAQAIASGWLAARHNEQALPPLQWSHQCRLTGHMARALLRPLWEAYGGAAPMPQWQSNAVYETSIELELTGTAMGAWYGLGPERTYSFFKSLSKVSTAIQSAVRRWLPVLWMENGELLHSTREGIALLAYTSLPALLPRSRRCYTFDPVDNGSWLQALTYATRRLPKQLQIWYPALAAMDHPAAELIHPRWQSRWGGELVRNGKRLQTLLANEAWMIDQFVNFAAGLEDQAAQPTLNGCIRKGRDLHDALDTRLRRWWEGRQAQALNRLVLIEATSALTTEPVRLSISMRKMVPRHDAKAPLVMRTCRGPRAPAEESKSGEAA